MVRPTRRALARPLPPDLTFLGPRHYPARPISLFRVSEFEMKNSDYPLVN